MVEAEHIQLNTHQLILPRLTHQGQGMEEVEWRRKMTPLYLDRKRIMQTNHAYYFCLNILNTFYNLSVALGNGKEKGVNIFGEINLVQTIWLLCPSCIVSLTSSLLRISFSVCLVRLTAFL